ncbi:MAG: hypothetical protein HYV42_03510 [Candidatus Magasanikbacteria bacterium]|nr:hypothetical protein [Candidatus Magasanikbacteria bacterium]
MLYAIKLGPVAVGTGTTYLYLGLRNGGAGILPPVTGDHDRLALCAFVQQAPGEELYCEPSLEPAGALLGFRPAKLPRWAAPIRATLALTVGLGTLLQGTEPPAVELLIEGAAHFWRARPWRFWAHTAPLTVAISGARNEELEGSIMGAGGFEYGLALYHRKGALARMAALMAAGRRSAITEDGYAVTFDKEPAFAVEALDDAYSLPRVPFPVRVEKGRPASPRNLELALLSGALGAVAALSPEQPETSCEVELGDERLSVHVRAPERET